MPATTIDVASIVPVTRTTDAEPLATAAYDQLLTLLSDLDREEWARDTECPGWTVADMVGHLIGAAKANASLRENVRQQLHGVRHAREHADNSLDAVNALQVRDHRSLTPQERLATLRELAPRAVAGRARLPRLLRRIDVPIAQSGSSAGMPTRLNLGHLVDVVYTRDVWMHTLDIARACGRRPDPSAPGTPRLVADVVREWASLHGRPVELRLTGPAGGHFVAGRGGEVIELDPFEFCRVVSGRAPGAGLLSQLVIF
ncbi:MAG: maleylpyruvate isomerase family mycothiol-dependent enzyme [Motilibacteraceae bacterium]